MKVNESLGWDPPLKCKHPYHFLGTSYLSFEMALIAMTFQKTEILGW